MAGNASRRQIDRDEIIYARCQVKPLLKRLESCAFYGVFLSQQNRISFFT
jgi:hypothetical protein